LRVFSLTGWCRQIPTRRLRPRGTQDTTKTTLLTFTGLSPCVVLLPKSFNFTPLSILWSYNPGDAVTSPVWALSCSLATTYEIIIIFSSSAYLDVSVQQVCAIAIILQIIRFPHSEISGSKIICISPKLIAAYHVLHRLQEPRHPPCALPYFLLTIRFCSYSNALL
jgi:hypothetical protein